MALYSSNKKVSGEAIVNLELQAQDIENNTITASTATKLDNGAVTSGKLSSIIDLSSKTVTYRSLVDSDFSANAGITGSKLQSGWTTASLGYTPLNKAGDTLTGDLTLSGSQPALYFRGTDGGVNFAIGVTAGEGVQIWEPEDTGGTQTSGFSDNGKVWMNMADDGAASFPNGFSAAYTSAWYAVNSDDRTFRVAHSLGRLPKFGLVQWYSQDIGTTSVHYFGSNFSTYNSNDDGDAMSWDSNYWKMGIDDDTTRKAFFRANGNNSAREIKRSSQYGFRVLLW